MAEVDSGDFAPRVRCRRCRPKDDGVEGRESTIGGDVGAGAGALPVYLRMSVEPPAGLRWPLR